MARRSPSSCGTRYRSSSITYRYLGPPQPLLESTIEGKLEPRYRFQYRVRDQTLDTLDTLNSMEPGAGIMMAVSLFKVLLSSEQCSDFQGLAVPGIGIVPVFQKS